MLSANNHVDNIFLANIIRNIPQYVFWKNINSVYIGCNDNYAKLLGLKSSQEIIGKTDLDIGWLPDGDSAELFRRGDKETMRGKLITNQEEWLSLPNGIKILVLVNKAPILSDQGEVLGVLGVATDITEKKHTERMLKETNERLEKILNTIPGHVYWQDKKGVILGCNDKQAHSLGFKSHKEVIGKTPYDLLPKDQADFLMNINKKVMEETKGVQIFEEKSTFTYGDAYMLSQKVPLYDDNGEVSGILGISFDITEQKRVEKELQETQHKLEGMTLVSASVAHELRTPLRTINSSTHGIKKYLPLLIEAYRIAKKHHLPIPDIDPLHFNALQPALDSAEAEAHSAFTFIDMLLVKLTQTDINRNYTTCSFNDCMEKALARYPFDMEEKKLVHWQSGKDFFFRGSELLMVHILFNLLKNALYYIRVARKGEINIWLTEDEKNNVLHFKDTGLGISPDILPHIFDRFFSKTQHGTGVGLAFCKLVMQSFSGDIICLSKEKEYAEFVLNFPKDISLKD